VKPSKDVKIGPDTRVAIIMPVYNEDVPRIFAGLKAMYESLQATGELYHFDFYILSDSTKPEQHQQEELYWANFCAEVNGHGRIFYRRRKVHLHKKSGNVSDFCRRWGKKYTYLLPLDADSIMSGRLMVDLVRILESRPDAGIVQTSPKGINQLSLWARLQQFSSHVYGPLHLAGSHFWQMADAGFWGHNALIRMEPFLKYCALPTLPGRPPFGGEILSHDFIEAALMRRAGWGVWLTYELEESFEELPPNLIEELRRDNRWCQGNLQHLRLMFWRGFSFGHRLLFLNGNMAYFSALLWFALLVLMTVYAIVDFLHKPEYFSGSHSLFPQWPIHYTGLSLQLLLVTVIFLLGPKLLSLFWILLSGKDLKYFGGFFGLVGSVFFEIIFSIFLAPIKMMFHTGFIISNLVARKLVWGKQQRDSARVTFVQAALKFGFVSVAAVVWGFLTYAINKTLFLWLLPILIPLGLSIPLVMFSSSSRVGLFLKRCGIFLTPIETHPPEVMIRLNELSAKRPAF
jgi:membrane glycosyltransferase